MVPVGSSRATKGSTNKTTSRASCPVDIISSEESKSASEGGNNSQDGMVGKTGDNGNSGDEKDVVVVDG